MALSLHAVGYTCLATLALLLGCEACLRAPPPRRLGASSAIPASSGSVVVPARANIPEARELCGLPVDVTLSARSGVVPPNVLEPTCPENNPFCDMVDTPPEGADACYVANANLAAAERSIAVRPGPMVGSSAWDRKTRPKYLERIDAHFRLTEREKQTLAREGFVVLDRLAYQSYAAAYHDIFQEQLPVMVTLDSVLFAMFRATEHALGLLETRELAPALLPMLQKLQSTLARERLRYAPDVASSLEVYLGVAARLADPSAKPAGSPRARTQIDALLAHIASERLETIHVFGRERVVDFSQYKPRGHYADPFTWRYGHGVNLEAYFRAMTWLSRFEWNLVSRSTRSSSPQPDATETPHEVAIVHALSDLVVRAGVAKTVERIDRAYESFAGGREDVSLAEVATLLSGVPLQGGDVTSKLRSAVGDRYKRTMRTHFTPDGTRELPVISTMFGVRVVPDASALSQLVHDDVPDRTSIRAADVAFVLGHDRAAHYLSKDFALFPNLRDKGMHGRGRVRQLAGADQSVYASYLRTLLSLAEPHEGVIPSFARGTGYADMRINTTLTGYAGLRHTFLLAAAQGYDAYGCDIPDGYVEPSSVVWDKLYEQARAIHATSKGHARLVDVIGTLRTIARRAATGAALSEPEKRWLGMVSEHIPKNMFDSGLPPKWTGWYFDLFVDREHGATQSIALAADYQTLTNAEQVAYLGVEGVRLGVFVIDVGGEPRAMVGPVAKGFEVKGPMRDRYTDESILDAKGKSDGFRRSFAVEDEAVPEDAWSHGSIVPCGKEAETYRAFVSGGNGGALAEVEVMLRDHHGDPLFSPSRVKLRPEGSVIEFRLPTDYSTRASALGVSAYAVRVHLPNRAPYDFVTAPGYFVGKDARNLSLPSRPKGLGTFELGRAGAAHIPAQDPSAYPFGNLSP